MALPLYSPLTEDDFEIRILDVLPSISQSSPIKCMCRPIALAIDPVPRFTALSYFWGPNKPACDIVVNDALHRIGPNLASALRNLRHEQDSVSVWVDAICINQEDDEEKTSQLFIMDDVYRDAERVFIWLGEESEDSSLAMRMIQRWASGMRYSMNTDNKLCLLAESEKDEVFSYEATSAVDNLLQRSYWTRVWVQQEVALAQTVIVQCGTDSLPFDAFVKAQSEWEKVKESAFSTPEFLQSLWNYRFVWQNRGHMMSLITLRQQQQQLIAAPEKRLSLESQSSLFDFLRGYQHLRSSDPRDRIYGLLGLYSPVSRYRSQITPSYKKGTQEVFCDVARVLIHSDRSLRAVAFARNIVSDIPVEMLPSWVPDWTGTEELFPLHFRNRCQGIEAGTDLSTYIQISSDSSTLSVRGFLCDRVRVLHSSWGDMYGNNPTGFSALAQRSILPNGYRVIQAAFYLLSDNLDPDMHNLSSDEMKVRMAQAISYLLLMVPSTMPEPKRREEVIRLSQFLFGTILPEFLDTIERFFQSHNDGMSEPRFEDNLAKRQKATGSAFLLKARAILRRRTFFESQNGTLGIGPGNTKVGDAVLQTLTYPGYLLLQPGEKAYRLRGECSIFANQPVNKPLSEDLDFFDIA